MINYTFYVFTNRKTTSNLTLHQAIELYKNTNTQNYKALGATKDNTSCDLINNLEGNRISNDYKHLESFKSDNMVKVNILNILKREFNI
ncbi:MULTISPECIES: hypothetical protein [unclassified Clostridium]|uniref:hypothetical protein n=1 Tax=unclassified Clostridium TaxID=2614128 RepID=UPI0025C42AE4|nr:MULTISPECIES: hypothetical protein [unclassified Clostridium]